MSKYKNNNEENINTSHSHWMREWNAQDYKDNNGELAEIHKEYMHCKELADADLRWKDDRTVPRLFASDYYQVRHGGMMMDLKAIHVPNAIDQPFALNRKKIDKYFRWIEFSRTQEQEEIEADKIVIKERFESIRAMISNIRVS